MGWEKWVIRRLVGWECYLVCTGPLEGSLLDMICSGGWEILGLINVIEHSCFNFSLSDVLMPDCLHSTIGSC
jgi:hypothetical protein